MKRAASLLAAALISALMPVAARAQVFNPETFTLANGMQVVVVPNHRVPVVSHMVWYKVGAADEPAGKTGIAHLLEHLMFKGTKVQKPGEFSRIVARLGGRDNAFTSSDYTAYYQNIAADRLETMMRMEADRMANLNLDENNVKTELAVVREERRSRTDNDPGALLRERTDAALYVNHPYRNPVIGWDEELKRLSRGDALDFYKHWYGPNNAILVVSGDITAAQLKPMAERTYGKVKPVPVPQRVRAEEPPQIGARKVELRDERVTQPSWTRSYIAPSYHRGDSKHAYPLEVLAEVVGGGATSQLYRALVVEQGLASGAGAWYEPQAWDMTTMGFHATPRPGVTIEQVEAAMLAEIKKITENGVPAEEVERAKKRLIAGAVYARDSYHTGAQVFGQALATGQTVEDVEAWPRRIEAVTPEQVNKAAKSVIDADASVTSVLLPAEGSMATAGARGPAAPVMGGAKATGH